MKKMKEIYRDSLKELLNTRNMVLCGLMAALAVVLSLVASIDIGPYIRVGFSGLPNRVVECLFGPVTGCLFGGRADIWHTAVPESGDREKNRGGGISDKAAGKLPVEHSLDFHAVRKRLFCHPAAPGAEKCDYAAH